MECVQWECSGQRIVKINECVEDNGYAPTIWVMLENGLVQDDGVWRDICLKSVIVVEKLQVVVDGGEVKDVVV